MPAYPKADEQHLRMRPRACACLCMPEHEGWRVGAPPHFSTRDVPDSADRLSAHFFANPTGLGPRQMWPDPICTPSRISVWERLQFHAQTHRHRLNFKRGWSCLVLQLRTRARDFACLWICVLRAHCACALVWVSLQQGAGTYASKAA